ncbi:cytochrome c551 [Bacillus marinisedimentorum]|uniref:cytochrome c551 n=1 Tax=Bacillus marinisedimentorum TaxID=1821260 RepID=UPI0007E28B3B|nr:cytochrome c [Bacillus marinisedimentorum]
MSKKLLAILFGSMLVLGACGGGEENADEPAENNEPATEEPAEDEGTTDEGTTEEGGEEGAEEGEGTAAVDEEAAAELYAQSCVQCHGQNLEGQVGPALNEVGSKLSKDEILDIIENGQGSMPGGLLKGDDADMVATWLANMK